MINQIFSNDINILNYNTFFRGVALIPSALPIARLSVGNTRSKLVVVSSNLTVVQSSQGRYKVMVPQALISSFRFAQIDFSYEIAEYGPHVQSNIYTVNQRLVSFDEWIEFTGKDVTGEHYTDEDSVEDYKEYDYTETMVRNVIEAYCNQSFNNWVGTQKIYSAKSFIRLPQHMEALFSVGTGNENPAGVVESYESTLFSLSDSGYSVSTNTPYQTPSPIFQSSENNVYYDVTGEWGWRSLPEEVKRISLQLMKYYSSDKIENRYQFLVSNNAGGDTDSISFSFNAFRNSTGNPVADDILGPYRIFQVHSI